jgi:anti-sigma-K factor RskA
MSDVSDSSSPKGGSRPEMRADVHALAGAYALNALPSDEQAFFERHLAACDACRFEVAELQETAARLAAGVAAPAPPALRERVLAAADVTRQLPPEPATAQHGAARSHDWRQRLFLPVAASLVLIVVALSGVIVNLTSRAPQTGPEPTAVVSVLGAEDLQTVELDLGGTVPGRFLYSPSLDRGVLVAHGVADPGGRQTYEFWLMHDGHPVPAGLFRPDDGGAAIAEVTAPVRGAELVAITIEPAGGSERPTGEVLASAPLDS